jgi:hypothetical protein
VDEVAVDMRELSRGAVLNAFLLFALSLPEASTMHLIEPCIAACQAGAYPRTYPVHLDEF